jgi:hypothetical protein
MLYLAGLTNEDVLVEHLYGVSFDQRFVGEGLVTLDGYATINQIGFYGRVRAPDTGPTLLLFGLALATLWWAAGWTDHKKARRLPTPS